MQTALMKVVKQRKGLLWCIAVGRLSYPRRFVSSGNLSGARGGSTAKGSSPLSAHQASRFYVNGQRRGGPRRSVGGRLNVNEV